MIQYLYSLLNNYVLNRYTGLLVFIYAAVVIISFWKIFRKAGQPGWVILIPIYNFIILLEIVRKPWWYIFLLILAFPVNIVIFIMIINQLSIVFGKTSKFTVGLILLSIIFLPLLAFGSSKYVSIAEPQEQ